jgi:hypothetical protein
VCTETLVPPYTREASISSAPCKRKAAGGKRGEFIGSSEKSGLPAAATTVRREGRGVEDHAAQVREARLVVGRRVVVVECAGEQ